MSKMQIVQICAHRGASWNHPENTIAAFRGARAEGADWVELDVRINRIGDLIVHHDASFDDARGVWATPTSEVPAGVVELAAALDACEGMGVNIEIKNSPGDLGDASLPGDGAVPHDLIVCESVVNLVTTRPEQPILISSFDQETIDRVHDIDPTIATGCLVFDLASEPQFPERVAAAGHRAVNPWEPFVDAEFMERCRALGLSVNPWTTDDPVRIRELALLGVDSIITNRPQLAREAIASNLSGDHDGMVSEGR